MEAVSILAQSQQQECKQATMCYNSVQLVSLVRKQSLSGFAPQRRLMSPDFRHKQTREPPRMDDRCNWPSAHEELRLKAGESCPVRMAHQDFMDLIKACGKLKDLHKGSRIHADILKTGLLEKDIYIGTALVQMYAKCGAFAKAQEVFDMLPKRNVVSWNALIAGYAQHGLGEQALDCFQRMQSEGLSPDSVTFVCILKACGSIGAIKKGEEIHAEVLKLRLLENHDITLGNALVNMYVKCGAIVKAQEVFNSLPRRDAVSWNVLINGYCHHRFGEEALNCFGQMRDEGLSPDLVTFICILKACGSIGALEKGEEIHAEVCRLGLLENHDIVLGTALVDMYAKCGAVAKAQRVFDGLPSRNAISWTALIAGYVQQGLGEEAWNCFGQMRYEGFFPDAITFVCILKACNSISGIEKGEGIHAEIHQLGFLESHNIVLGNALMDMYAKCGLILKARRVLDALPVRDAVSWTILIAGYAQHGLGEEALNCFGQMRDDGFFPDAATFACILKACGSIGAIEKGKEIHAEVRRLGLLENHDVVLGTALVDMYVKCSMLSKAQQVFDRLPTRNTVSWNALMAGYAWLGKAEGVFNLFSKMRAECVEPDGVTFSVLLAACSHAGLVEEGQMYFDMMSTVYGIIPSSEHCTYLVDLFSHVGHFDKAISVIKKVPDSELWLAFLGACRKWVNVELARWAFEHALQFDDKCDAAYACMSNIYEAAGMQGEADKVHALRIQNGAWKVPGRSWWTDVGGNLHSFNVGDKSHPQSNCMYSKLKKMGQKLRLEGYSPNSHWVSQAMSDDGEEDILCGHSHNLHVLSSTHKEYAYLW